MKYLVVFATAIQLCLCGCSEETPKTFLSRGTGAAKSAEIVKENPEVVVETSEVPASAVTAYFSRTGQDGRTFGLHVGAVRRRLIRLVRHAGAH